MKRALLVMALIGAVTVSASALTLRRAHVGPVTFKIVNFDMGVIYDPEGGAAGTIVSGIGNVNALPQIDPPGADFDAIGGGLFTGGESEIKEDGWGIFRVTEIYNTADDSDILWEHGDNGDEIVGMFYGLIDNAVRFSSDSPGQTIIQSENITFDLYEQAVGTWAGTGTAGAPSLGSAGRLAFDRFQGVTEAGTLILRGESAQGDLIPLTGSVGPAEFHSFFKPNASLNSGDGTFFTRLDLVPGTRDYGQFNSNAFPGGVDFQVNGTTKSNAGTTALPRIADWTVRSEDPLEAVVIPEPVTLISVGLGAVSLGRYIRRRRA